MPVWIVIGVGAAVFVLVIVIAASFDVFSSETRDEAEERWTGLPEDFSSSDLEAVSFRPALRGYRMDDVDEAMALLHDRLRELEAAAGDSSAADGMSVAGGTSAGDTSVAGGTSAGETSAGDSSAAGGTSTGGSPSTGDSDVTAPTAGPR